MPRTYEIHSRLEWMRQKDEEAKARQREGKKMRAYIISAYNSRNEVRPDHKWYNLDKASVDKQICDIANQVKAQIAHARDGDKEMESFKKFVEDLQKVLLGEYTEAALVGMQGVGKSLLVNALFDRRNLSKTSAGGSACTAVAVRYLHKPEADDHSDDYDAEVQFMDDQNLEEIVQEHARRYHFYHFELQDDEEHSADDEKAADTALEFFQLVFDTVNSEANLSRLDKLLSSTAIRDGSLATETIQRALERIEQAGADTDRKRTFKNLDEADFIRLIGAYIAPSKDSPPLWPIVQYINLYLGSALARNRVAVIDSPGI